MGRPLSHAGEAERYADHVASGKIEACELARLACERFIRDLESGKDRGLHFDRDAANRICTFIELLPHIKGKWAKAGARLKLEPWQKFIHGNAFGWMKERDEGPPRRRFREVHEEVARKNGKSVTKSGVALYMLGPDEEEGAEVYSAATTRAQARIVFSVARHMALRTRRYQERFGIEVLKHALARDSTAATFQALSSDTDSMDGLNVHCAILDELHAHKSRALYDVIDTATGSRDQPLIWSVTTAGGNHEGICYERRSYLEKVLRGVLEDDSLFGIVYTTDDKDAWEDPAQWRLANPNFGVSVLPETIEAGARKAKQSAPALNNFLTKHLNIWVWAAEAYFRMDEFKAGEQADLQAFAAEAVKDAPDTFGIPPSFDGRDVWIGGDLASKLDVASLAFLFPEPDGSVVAFGRHYLPEDLVEERAASSGGHYVQWAKQGWLTLTKGNMIDFDRVEEDIVRAAGRFNLRGYCYDPWQSHQMVGHLMEKSLPCVEIKPTVGNFSPAMKEVSALLKASKFRHAGDPCAAWMLSNVVAREDYKENVFPRKEQKTSKIDWLVAALSAMNRIIVPQEEDRSVYEDRGVTVF